MQASPEITENIRIRVADYIFVFIINHPVSYQIGEMYITGTESTSIFASIT